MSDGTGNGAADLALAFLIGRALGRLARELLERLLHPASERRWPMTATRSPARRPLPDDEVDDLAFNPIVDHDLATTPPTEPRHP